MDAFPQSSHIFYFSIVFTTYSTEFVEYICFFDRVMSGERERRRRGEVRDGLVIDWMME